MTDARVRFTLNGSPRSVAVESHQTALDVLRDELGATEVKYGCGEGVCGTCTVVLDGALVSSCLLFAVQLEGSDVLTVRGLEQAGELHPLQRAFLDHGAAQCGFCTPGMILTAYRLSQEQPDADEPEIREALSGNLCRCTGYTKIVAAVRAYLASGDDRSEEG
jgi:carbon-monoxide dehydrogenase small subunit